MKQTLMILGGIFAVLIIAGVIGFSIIAVKGKALDEESKAYVDKVTPIILADLNKETLLEYASEELKKSVTPAELDKIFNWFTRLGQFKEYKGSKGQATISVTKEKGKQVTGLYEASAEFEKGPATIRIKIINKDNKWYIVALNIESTALVNE